jgi:serine/threonine protein kinase
VGTENIEENVISRDGSHNHFVTPTQLHPKRIRTRFYLLMSVYECPYMTGAEFEIILSDPAHLNGASTCHARLKVLQTYPFTKSQCMKVALLNTSGDYPADLPSIAFLKLYDRRYLNERMTDGEHPWNHQKETAAERISQKLDLHLLDRESIIRSVGLSSHCGNDGEVVVSEAIDFDEDDYDEQLKSLDSADADAVKQWKIEMDYHYKTTSWFKTECRAYQQLRSLQGISVPTFYGTTLFDETSQLAPGVDTKVLGILLQFIDGVTLEELHSLSTLITRNPHIGQIAVDCLVRTTSFGVLHGDIRLANIMVCNNGRVYLLDFGFASFRGQGVSDQDWERRVVQLGGVLKMKIYLDEKELRDQTPPEPYSTHVGDYFPYNHFIQMKREAWKLKYYEHGTYENCCLSRLDKDGIQRRVWLPLWVPKYEALTNRKIELDRLRLRYSQMIDTSDSIKHIYDVSS